MKSFNKNHAVAFGFVLMVFVVIYLGYKSSFPISINQQGAAIYDTSTSIIFRINDKVVTIASADLFNKVNGGKKIGTVPSGTKGTVLSNVTKSGSNLFVNVVFENSITGWINITNISLADVTAPVLKMLSPLNGITVSPYTVFLTIDVRDDRGTIKSLKMYMDGNLVKEFTNIPNGVYTTAVNGLSLGSHVFGADATDPAGNLGIDPNTITVVNPTIVNGVFTATFGGQPGLQYIIQKTISLSPQNWVVVSTTTADANGVFSYSESIYTSTSGFFRALDVLVNQPPTVTFSVSTTTTTAPASITLSATSTDSDGTVSNVSFYNGATLLNTDVTSPYSYLWSNVPNGVYSLSAKAFDNSGATTTSNTINVTVSTPFTDTTPPVVTTFTIPSTSSSLTIPISAFSATDNVNVTGYMINASSTAPSSTTPGWTSIATTTYTFTSAGSKTLYAWAKDAAGNVSLSKSASVIITLSTSIFPLHLSGNSRYLLDINNNPFPILGRTAWFLTSLPSSGTASYKTFIDDTANKGYSFIEIHVINHDPRGNNEPFGGNGSLPFLKKLNGADWGGSLTYSNINNDAPDYTTPNETYWSHVDGLLAYAESKNIAVFFFPSYVGYAGGEQGWMQEMVANGSTKIQTYGTWLANRYKNQKNLVWMMGGDYGTIPHAFTAAETAVENALINGLKSVTGQQSTFFSAEWDSQSIATDQTSLGTQMTLNGAYSWTGDVNYQGRRAYSYSGVRPAFLLEEPYDQEGPDGNSANPSAIQPVRRFQWWGWLSTIGGYVSGNGYVWPFNSGWNNYLSTQGANDMSRLNTFIKSIAWYNLVPSGLNSMRTLISGNAGTSASNYVSAAATPTGNLLVAYIPPAHSGSITVDMTGMAVTRARWFDPTNGSYTTISGTLPNTGTKTFTRTGNNSVGQADWVLILDN